jgi:hypothetical protein
MIQNRINPLPLTENKSSAWRNRVAGSLNAHNLIAGSGIRVDYTPQGAVISLNKVDEHLPIKYVGDYNSDMEYYPNQIVRVRPDKVYLDITGTPLDIGSTADSGYETFPISPGLFICVGYIPPGNCDETWFSNYIVPAYPGGVPYDVIQSTRWNSYNVYWPQYPEIPTSYTASVTVYSNSQITANNTFWNALPIGMRAMNMCLPNGTLATAYVMAYISGSAFLPEYLPYQP